MLNRIPITGEVVIAEHSIQGTYGAVLQDKHYVVGGVFPCISERHSNMDYGIVLENERVITHKPSGFPFVWPRNYLRFPTPEELDQYETDDVREGK